MPWYAQDVSVNSGLEYIRVRKVYNEMVIDIKADLSIDARIKGSF
jgi:ribosome-associated protein YbcJ (S4-like RNA binding protein)